MLKVPKPLRKVEQQTVFKMSGLWAFSVREKLEYGTWYNETKPITQMLQTYREKSSKSSAFEQFCSDMVSKYFTTVAPWKVEVNPGGLY